MVEMILDILRETRPLQWVKNLTIFVFLIFSKQFFIGAQFIVVAKSFGVFTLLTSSIYIFNDIIDIPSDRKNPVKKNRPIASGRIPLSLAWVLFVVFLGLSLMLALKIGEYLFIMCVIYALLMILYTVWLKNIEIIDALVIAGGFVIRVIAGAFIINVSNLYSWIIIVTISISLLLAFGKRRSELTLLGESSAQQRKVLSRYPADLLNSLISALVASTFLSYILLTFQTDLQNNASIINFLMSSSVKVPYVLSKNPHLLKLTIPIVFYGIARYLYLIYTKKIGGTPEKVLFTDIPLLLTVIIWFASLFALLYAV